jgi:hypothetical protein
MDDLLHQVIGKKCQKRRQLVSWMLEEALSTCLCFVYFLVFLLFVAYEFWFVFFMECQHPYQELTMELYFRNFFIL